MAMIKQKADKSHQAHHQKQQLGVAALQSAVASIFNTSEQSKYCLCDICLQNYQLKQKGQQFLKQSSSMFKIELPRMKKFYQFLSSVDHKVYFRLQMSEICFFEGGEGKVLFKTKGFGVIMVQLNAEMKKQIPNIFVDSKKILNQHTSIGEQNNHIRYFQSVVPSFKHGLSNDNLDNKPKNYTFHSDDKKNQENLVYKMHYNPTSEVAIIKYKDKGLQLVNEKQLRQILKSAVKSNNIQLIQGFVKPHERQSQFIFSQYLDYRKPQNVLMFNRSMIQMKTEIGLISKYSKDYIPMEYLDQYEQMLKEMSEEYCLYETYKMVHYIQINRDVRVKHLNTVWFKDQCKEINFFGVMQFDYEQNQKVNTDINNILELKDVLTTELTDLQKELLGAWENMKKRKMKQYKQRIEVQPNVQKLQELQLIKRQSLIPKAQRIYSSRKASRQL